MSARFQTALLACALAVIAATPALAQWVAAAAGRPGAVSPVVFPPQSIALRFSHRVHATTACEHCHATRSSRAAADRLLPAEAACTGAGCHAIDRTRPAKPAAAGAGPAACVACHAGFDAARPTAIARTVVPLPNLKFSHATHLARTSCKSCHGDVAALDLATRDSLPRMATCLGCHDGRTASAACTTCHLGLPDGRMRSNFPEGALRPSGQLRADDHDLGFRTRHGHAGQDAEYCASCHKQRFCEDCHAGEVKPSGAGLHPGDYLTIHAIDARKNAPACEQCHTRQVFCVGCHQRSGLGADPPSAFARAGAAGRFHPAGWTDPVRRGPNHHAWQAMRNLTTCASCHRESSCMQCHTGRPGSGQSGVSPHPRGFAGSGACRSLVRRNQRVCIKCHVPEAPALDCER